MTATLRMRDTNAPHSEATINAPHSEATINRRNS